MTRFAKISPLWQFNEGLFIIWQNLLPTLSNFVNNWAIFHGCKWTKNENYKSHLVTLVRNHIGHLVNQLLSSWTMRLTKWSDKVLYNSFNQSAPWLGTSFSSMTRQEAEWVASASTTNFRSKVGRSTFKLFC